MSEPLDLLGEPITIQPLDRIRDPGMHGSPPVVEQALVRHVVSESVLEGVLDFGVEARLVEELGGLQVVEPCAQRSPSLVNWPSMACWCSMKIPAFGARRGFLDRTAMTLHSAMRGLVT